VRLVISLPPKQSLDGAPLDVDDDTRGGGGFFPGFNLAGSGLCEFGQGTPVTYRREVILEHSGFCKWLAIDELNACELWHGACDSRGIDIFSTD
jgi:hypothetical protein